MPFIVLTPAIGWAWPALLPILSSVAASLGFQKFSHPTGMLRGGVSNEMDQLRIERVALDSVLADVIAEEIGTEKRLTLKRDDIVLVFRKDALGKFHVDVMGPNSRTAMELKALGEQFAVELVQKFAYNKIITQLERTGVTVIDEKVEPDGRIILRTRKWQ